MKEDKEHTKIKHDHICKICTTNHRFWFGTFKMQPEFGYKKHQSELISATCVLKNNKHINKPSKKEAVVIFSAHWICRDQN